MPDQRGVESFPREVAAAAATFTGERLTSARGGQVMVEHYHRYLLARDHCVGGAVLDIAAGEGYGTALLAQVASTAVGIEIDRATVAAAHHAFARPNLSFLVADARAIPLADASMDVVVSFETLEHFAEHDQFLTECRRVLRPEGLLIVSTPDRDVYSRSGTAPNPFHARELDRGEFEALLRRHFGNVSIVRQRPMIGSAILADGRMATVRVFEMPDAAHFEAADSLTKAPYLIAFASDGAVPAAAASVFVQRDDLDTDAEQRAAAEAERLAMHTAHQAMLAAHQAALADLRMTSTRLQAIETSTSWRVTRRFRDFGRRHPSLARTVRRALLLSHWALTGQLRAQLARRRAANLLRVDITDPARLAAVRSEFGMATPGGAAIHDPKSILLPQAADPIVSIIIPSYGQVPFTLRCLRSIMAAPPAASIEVIVAEDASGDDMVPLLRQVRGLILRENPRNLGFLLSCNAAAQAARGRYLLFLNNDTELQPGAVDALVARAASAPDIGMVGARLVYPDGRLQEAGGIIWNDASAWNYGNGQDPRRPEFTYARDVDYCSGAALLLERPLFEALGGFDEAFIPAYCEDSDLAFRVRARGLRVVYEPRAVVVHHEGVSHGTDVTRGIKAYQQRNQELIATRWHAVLAADHFPNGRHLLRARDRARHRKVVLIVDHYAPEPDRDAGSRTMVLFIETLLGEGWVVKFWAEAARSEHRYVEALEALGVEVIRPPWSPDFADWLRDNGAELDHVLLSRPDIADRRIEAVRTHSRAAILFYGHDLHGARLRQQAALTGTPPVDAERIEQIERAVWRRADVVLYPSAEEVAAVLAHAPATQALSIPPYCFHQFEERIAAPVSEALIFVAGFAHPPNIDAATWLIREVLPLTWRKRPTVTAWLVGSHPSPEVLELAGPKVRVTGAVTADALIGLYASARVAAVPLRAGAGVKLKVVEALQQGVPMITTEVGAQGLPGLADIVPVCGDPANFADAILHLMADDAAWLNQSVAQTAYARERFAPAAMRHALLAAFDAANAAATARR